MLYEIFTVGKIYHKKNKSHITIPPSVVKGREVDFLPQ